MLQVKRILVGLGLFVALLTGCSETPSTENSSTETPSLDYSWYKFSIKSEFVYDIGEIPYPMSQYDPENHELVGVSRDLHILTLYPDSVSQTRMVIKLNLTLGYTYKYENGSAFVREGLDWPDIDSESNNGLFVQTEGIENGDFNGTGALSFSTSSLDPNGKTLKENDEVLVIKVYEEASDKLIHTYRIII